MNTWGQKFWESILCDLFEHVKAFLEVTKSWLKKHLHVKYASKLSYLTRATFVAGAIILVNYNWILDILYSDMLKKNVPSKPIARPSPWFNPHPILSNKPIARPSPWFNPHPILSTGKCNCCDCYVLYTSFLLVLA